MRNGVSLLMGFVYNKKSDVQTGFDEGKADVFSIPVSKAVEYMEQTMLKGHTVEQ